MQTKEGILINNQAATEELQDFENVRNRLMEKSKEPVEEQKSISLSHVSESHLATLEVCSTSKSKPQKNTKKRQQRAASKKWGYR